MNNTVQLVNEWAAYEASHPEANIEEFCRFYLTAQHAKREMEPPFGGKGIPPTQKSFLAKLIGFVASTLGVYFEKAFVDIPEIRQKEDFYFLNNISHKGECRKTEVVHEQLLGLTTGIDTLNRLLANELINERPDPNDKRAKLLSITPKGAEVLQRCYRMAQKATEITFHDLSEEDVRLCIQLLRGVEARHAPLMLEMKDKTIEEIAERIAGKTNSTTTPMSRKAMTQAYKNQKQPMGVFQIRNTVNGKIYLESSPNLDKIWNRHQFELKLGSHRNAGLQHDWNNFGEDAFVFEILSEIEQKEGETSNYTRDLKTLEQLFLEELQPYGDRGYHQMKST